jgi:hypothetical protein
MPPPNFYFSGLVIIILSTHIVRTYAAMVGERKIMSRRYHQPKTLFMSNGQ